MATGPEKAEEEFFPIHLAIMQPGTVTPVNLYLRGKAGGPFILYKRAHTPLREDIRERLIANRVESLYLRTEDRAAYDDYVEENITAIVRDGLLPRRKACRIIYETSGRVMERLFNDPRSGKSMQRARKAVQATVLSILDDPETLWDTLSMAEQDYYTHTHCVNVSLLLVGVSRDVLGITDASELERIGLGGIFHDIGKSRIPPEILNKPGRLTPEEFAHIKHHPQLGVEIASAHRRIAPTTRQIILSHHEHYNGAGYPRGVASGTLSAVVRMANIVDVYDALTTRRPYSDARPAYDALRLMLDRMDAELDRELLERFVEFLGPYEFRQALRARHGPARGRPGAEVQGKRPEAPVG